MSQPESAETQLTPVQKACIEFLKQKYASEPSRHDNGFNAQLRNLRIAESSNVLGDMWEIIDAEKARLQTLRSSVYTIISERDYSAVLTDLVSRMISPFPADPQALGKFLALVNDPDTDQDDRNALAFAMEQACERQPTNFFNTYNAADKTAQQQFIAFIAGLPDAVNAQRYEKIFETALRGTSEENYPKCEIANAFRDAVIAKANWQEDSKTESHPQIHQQAGIADPAVA